MENQTVQNPTSEPTLTPVQVPEPKANFPVMYLVLSFLILVFLVSTALLYYQNMQLKNMLTSYQTQPIISPIPTTYQSPVPTIDPTANWKTYTNSEYKYQLKYPNDWSVKENSGQDTVGNQVQNTTFYSPTKDYALVFGVRKSGETINIVGRSGVSAGDFVASNPIPFDGSSLPTKNLVYKGKIKAVFYQPEADFYKVNNFEVYADFDRVTYDDYEGRDILNLPELAEANQILSTFKFTK